MPSPASGCRAAGLGGRRHQGDREDGDDQRDDGRQRPAPEARRQPWRRCEGRLLKTKTPGAREARGHGRLRSPATFLIPRLGLEDGSLVRGMSPRRGMLSEFGRPVQPWLARPAPISKVLGSRYASIPQRPISRPSPECLKPPNGAARPSASVLAAGTRPRSIWRATRSQRSMSWEHLIKSTDGRSER